MAHGAVTLHTTGEAETERFLYGIIAEFERAEDVVAAARRTREAGYRRIDAYTPFPVDGLSEALGFRDQKVPFIMLISGLAGALGGFALLYWAMAAPLAVNLNIGGRPLYGWPYFIPITFECTVLLAALAGVFGMFAVNGLPQPYHPVFDAPDFPRASSDRFFLCVEAEDPNFDRQETRRFMETLGAVTVADVELRK
jgi:Protein of unknown function (DUF3341)